MTVLVTGVHGNIGSRVAAKLVEAGHRVRGSSRRPSAAPEGVEPVELDLTEPRGAAEVLAGVEAVFLYPVRGGSVAPFLEAARKADVQHVVLLSSPAAFEVHEHDRLIGLVHRAVEQAVQDSGLSHTVLYPSWLASNARRDWGEQIRARGRVGIAHPDAQVNPIHIDDVAEVAADVLTRDAHRSRMLVLTGPESVPQRSLVDVLADVRGAPIGIDALTREEALAQRPEWMPEPVLEALLDVAAAAVGVPATVTNTVERVTGHPSRTFREWATAHRHEFV
ncbi:uncharacterized protein YbjT (DUF2867 family) [Pseudonocardia hierapolitana]|uniref:Uncharacterized protein YbjT (DUF2867 family) n=1 Tax=Pseudonocardia hierapolitana TaxID=1128676 RepID=A0A561SX46_9PSEU|nr:NAD(P)H-binding protein [Pseudonocardia hierapolitana]TWF79427.1 uncharacterized protein YbjT (DUF2867 family) [Pseudonocardia hierapolitana]